MLESSEEIQQDIEETLKQLMQNAMALKIAKTSHHFKHEVEQLEHLQESLLARLMHRQSLLEMDSKRRSPQTICKSAIKRKAVEYTKPSKARRLNVRPIGKVLF